MDTITEACPIYCLTVGLKKSVSTLKTDALRLNLDLDLKFG